MKCFAAVAVLVVLSVCCPSFGAVSYDAGTFTLIYGAPSDLGSTIDPPGLADIQQECDVANLGMTKAEFLALNPQVVTFDTATARNGGSGWLQYLAVTYAAGKTVTFTLGDPTATPTPLTYNWGGYDSAGRSAFSGPFTYSDISTVETQPDNCWFDVPAITVSPAGQGVKAIAFCAHGRNDGTTPPPEPPAGPDDKQSGPGDAVFTLSDDTTESVHYDMFGGNGIPLQRIFIGYQAPEGKTITAFRCTRPGSGNSFIAVDDLAFVMTAPTAVLIGDINGDGFVNVGDLQALVAAWGSTDTTTPPSSNWNADADINDDGFVNVGDLQLLVAHWGEHL